MAQEGDTIQLKNQEVQVIRCEREDCDHLMVNLDADQLQPGDLAILKREGVRISNPETDAPICVNCEHKTLGRRLSDWFDTEDDDDSSFFSTTSTGSIFSGSSSFGGFGGFGGGSFGGGGASRGF